MSKAGSEKPGDELGLIWLYF